MSAIVASPASARPPESADLPTIAARIGARVVGPAARDVDRAARFPFESFQALRAERMLSVLVPAELGGAGARLVDVAKATEVLSQYCASTGLIYAMHQIQVASVARHGHGPWARQFLTDVAARELLLASATTETGIGGDVRSSLCAVQQIDGRFHLQKNTPVISYGNHADAILVTARRDPESPQNDQVLVIVPVTATTLEQRSDWDTLGFRGTCSNGFLLTAEGDVDQILSDAYADISARTMLPTSHVVWSSVWLGIATAAVDIARAHIRGEARKKPGTVPPAALRLAELVGILGQLQSLVHGAAADYEAILDDEDQLSNMSFAIRMNALKTSASALVVDIVGRSLTVCGMAGYREDSPLSLSRNLRDAFGAVLMINNDRILAANAQMLLVHKGEE